MASSTSLSASESTGSEGPVLNLMSKRLRALRKKYNRILQMEASIAQGKTLNKEQEEVLRSKPTVVVLIDEYEKLRPPLAAAVLEELARATASSSSGNPNLTTAVSEEASSSADSAIEDLLPLLYFGCLFDVKPQSEFTSMMLTRAHERGCCLTYDYVSDEATELLGEKDLDTISALGGLVTSRPLYSGISHRSALQGCLEHAKLWLQGAHQPIESGSAVTYASLREKINKIMSSDYCTTTPEMRAPVDVAAAVGKYNAAFQMQIPEPSKELTPDAESDAVRIDFHRQDDEQEDIQDTEGSPKQTESAVDLQEDETDDSNPTARAVNALQQEQQIPEADAELSPRDNEQKDQQYVPQRSYQNPRGGRGSGSGRRGYSNARGRSGQGGGGGYQNGQSQYNHPGYHPRNYYNIRGRGGRSESSAMYNNHGASSHGSHGPSNVELGASA